MASCGSLCLGLDHTANLLIETTSSFDLELTCRAHGWVNLAPFVWLEDERMLRFSTRLSGGPCTLLVAQLEPCVLNVTLDAAADFEEVEACIQRVLMFDWDVQQATAIAERCDKKIASILRAGGGRLLRGHTDFEDIAKTICTINTSWRNTKSMIQGLVSLTGSGVFPSPQEVANSGEEGLRRRASVGYRASTLVAVAELARDRDVGVIDLQMLRKVKGLGPYAVDHIRVLRGDYSRIPVDSEVQAYCAKHLKISEPDASKIHQHFVDWGLYRFLGYKFGRIARSLNWAGD